MYSINFFVITSSIKHPNNQTIFKLVLCKSFKSVLLLFKESNFVILEGSLNFLVGLATQFDSVFIKLLISINKNPEKFNIITFAD